MKYLILMLLVLNGCCSDEPMTSKDAKSLRESAKRICKLKGTDLLMTDNSRYSEAMYYTCVDGTNGYISKSVVVE